MTELELLHKADDPEGVEYPESNAPDFNDLWLKVAAIKNKILSELKLDLEIDRGVQDATFFTTLFLLSEEQSAHRKKTTAFAHEFDIAIRFSSFGKLTVIYSGTDKFANFDTTAISQIVSENGFVLISESTLQKPYDGRNTHFKGESWWNRYFDYC